MPTVSRTQDEEEWYPEALNYSEDDQGADADAEAEAEAEAEAGPRLMRRLRKMRKMRCLIERTQDEGDSTQSATSADEEPGALVLSQEDWPHRMRPLTLARPSRSPRLKHSDTCRTSQILEILIIKIISIGFHP